MNLNCLARKFSLKSSLICFNLFLVKSRCYGSCKSRRGPPWSVLFFGTDSFALYSLKSLWAKLNTGTIMSDLAVVSKQGCLVRKFAEEEGLTVYEWPLTVSDIESKYHIGMVVSFGNMLSEDVIKSFPLGCINVHASLLPRWRGAAPIIHAISNGDHETGVTIMKIRPDKFDTGEIVRQYRVPIGSNEMSKDIESKLGICGSNLLMECLRDLPRCLDMAIPQPKHGITYAPKVKATMASVDWGKMSALNVYNLHRALHHIYPITTRWDNQHVKLHQVSLDKILSDSSLNNQISSEEISKQSALNFLSCSDTSKSSINFSLSQPNSGCLSYDKQTKELKIICADGNYLLVQTLSVGGKKMSCNDFYNGFMSKKSKKDWKFHS